MEFEKYIFVDYENVQDINTNIISKNVKMLIIVGENQNKISIELIQKTQPFGDSIEWLKIKSYGKKNALDFFITYFVGFYIGTQENKEYIIYSKDTGYDPLIEYLMNKKINIKRIVSFKQLDNNGLNKKDLSINNVLNENILKINENLNKIQINARPKTKKGLLKHIKTFSKKSNEEIEKMIEDMFINNMLYEENGRLKYKI